MSPFFSELKRRRVYRVAFAYGIFASAMIQVGRNYSPDFSRPGMDPAVFVVLIAIGFPFALVLGWVYDITAEGIRRTPNAKGLRVYSKRQLWLVGVAGTCIAALALSGYWFWHPWRKRDRRNLGCIQQFHSGKKHRGVAVSKLKSGQRRPPFCRGRAGSNSNEPGQVSDLRVISHTSVQQYRNELGRNVREIAGNSVSPTSSKARLQRAPNRVRVNAKLIDARTDSQIWADSYDRDVADLFVIQSDIAQTIVNQLQAKLSPQQKAEIERNSHAGFSGV